MLIDDVVIKLDRFGKEGKPDYSITIQGNGKIVYEGRKNVGKIGFVESNISEEEFMSLLSDFKNSDFFSLNKDFLSDSSESVNKISISLPVDDNNVKTNKISFNENAEGLPISLKFLSNKIDEIAGSSKWIHADTISKATASNKDFNGFLKNKKLVVGAVGVVAAIVVIAAIFSSGIFDSQGNNLIDNGDNNDAGDNGGNNGEAPEDTKEEFSNPEIFFITTTDQSTKIGDQRVSKTTSFKQTDIAYVYIEFRNITHNNSYNFTANLTVTNNNKLYYQNLSFYNNSEADTDEFYLINDIPTSESWESEQFYNISISIGDLISNKEDSIIDSFYLTDINLPEPRVVITTNPSPASGTEDLDVQFYSTVYNLTGDIDYDWDFGDGGSSSDEDPAHTYTTPDIYTATLTVTDSEDITLSDSVVVVVNEEVGDPTATFYANRTSGYAPLSVQFTSTWENLTEPVAYAWNFKDGGTSTVQNPEHTFNEPDTYNVILTITDSSGFEDSLSLIIEVFGDITANIDDPYPSVVSGYSPLIVNFNGSASGGDGSYTYEWDFNYNEETKEFNPSGITGSSATHTFETPGSYSVKMRATDMNGKMDVSDNTIFILVY